jgi:hypothetical protein
MNIIRLIPLIPWWLAGKILKIERVDRDYDWSLSGMLRSTPGRAVVMGWLFWVIVVAGLVLILRGWQAA